MGFPSSGLWAQAPIKAADEKIVLLASEDKHDHASQHDRAVDIPRRSERSFSCNDLCADLNPRSRAGIE
jgi:hypothetical protein